MSHVAPVAATTTAGPRTRRVLLRIVTALCGVLLLGVGLVNVFAPRDSAYVYAPLRGAVVIAACWIVGWLCSRCLRLPLVGRLLTRRWVHTALALALAPVALLCAYYSEYAYDWDPSAVRQAAYRLARGDALNTELLAYFARYPNNLSLSLVDTALAKTALVTHLSFATVTIVWNTVLLTGAQLLLARCLRTIGRPQLVVPMLLCSFLWVGTSSIMVVPYTDIPGFFTASLLLVLILDLRRRRRAVAVAVQVALVFGIIGLTFTIKPYVAILAMAGVAVYPFTDHRARLLRGPRGWGGMALLGLTGLVSVWLGHAVAAQASYANAGVSASTLQKYNSPFPLTHWVAMGIHDTHAKSPARTYGSFNTPIMRRDVKIKDEHRRSQVIDAGIKADLRRQGLVGNMKFFSKKICWVLGDGNFYAQKDGSDFRKGPTHRSTIADFTMLHGRHHEWKAGLVQGVWCSFILQLGWLLLRSRPRPVTGWLALAIIGFALYEVPFEGRSRYTLAMLPVFIVLFAALSRRWNGTLEREPEPEQQAVRVNG